MIVDTLDLFWLVQRISSIFHQNHLFKWLLTKYEIDKIGYSAVTMNIQTFLLLIESIHHNGSLKISIFKHMLNLSSKYCLIPLTEYLILNSANIECKNNFNEKPLHYAVIHNHLEIVKFLVLNGANIECKNIHSY